MKKTTQTRNRQILITLSLVCLLGFANCTKILVKPDIYSVKKIGIVSLYSNYDIYYVKSQKTKAEGLNALKIAVGTALNRSQESLESEERLQITTYALKTFETQLQTIGEWNVIPTASIINNAAYAGFRFSDAAEPAKEGIIGKIGRFVEKVATSEWVTPPGVQVVPLSEILEEKGKIIISNQITPSEQARQKMAQLCRALDLDGIAVVQVDLAYDKTWLSSLSGSGLFSFIRGRAKPCVGIACVVINREGKIVLETPAVDRGKGDRFCSGKVPMLERGQVTLKDSKDRVVHGYNLAIEKAILAFKEKIGKEWAAK